MRKRLTTKEFVDKSEKIHGNKYDYSKTEYVTNKIKVIITCPIHGDFEQQPNNHLNGNGCPECFGSKRKSIENFILDAKNVHNSGYDYSKVKYVSRFVNVNIICPIHGEFLQTPSNHLKGQNCPYCVGVKKYTNKEFISLLTIEESPIEIDNILHCKCSKCKQYFIPTRSEIKNRIKCLLNKEQGEGHLYCSKKCKDECVIYHQHKYPKNNKPYNDRSRPIQRYLRDIVLKRDNYQCQICGCEKNLHCHHFIGVEINPIESADVDNCITLCRDCHISKAHSENGCEVRRKECE